MPEKIRYIYKKYEELKSKRSKMTTTVTYPSNWDYSTTNSDTTIWNALREYNGLNDPTSTTPTPQSIITGANASAQLEIRNLIKLERNKKNFLFNRPLAGNISLAALTDAIAPFPVPDSPDGIGLGELEVGKFYHFQRNGYRFNGKISRTHAAEGRGPVFFEKDSVMVLTSVGAFEGKMDGCKVADHPAYARNDPNDATKTWIVPTLIGTTDPTEIKVPYSSIMNVKDSVVLRPYRLFRRLVDEAHSLKDDCLSKERLGEIVGKLRKLFVQSKLDPNGLPMRRTAIDFSKLEKIEEAARKAELAAAKTAREAAELKKRGDRVKEFGDTEVSGKKRRRPYYSLYPIDKRRLDWDTRLWRREKFGAEYVRKAPTIYDAMEILKIDKTKNLIDAIADLLLTKQANAGQPKKEWEAGLMVQAGGVKLIEDILLPAVRFSKDDEPRGAIVKRLMSYPKFDGKQLPVETLRSKAFESMSNVTEDFAKWTKHEADKNYSDDVWYRPWPETKRFMREFDTFNAYDPRARREFRYPECFYLDLKKEHEACERLRHIATQLSLSREKDKPVILRPRIVSPEAYGSDYMSQDLPRVLVTKSGHVPDTTYTKQGYFHVSGTDREFERVRRKGGDKVQSTAVNPLYPSRKKIIFMVP